MVSDCEDVGTCAWEALIVCTLEQPSCAKVWDLSGEREWWRWWGVAHAHPEDTMLEQKRSAGLPHSRPCRLLNVSAAGTAVSFDAFGQSQTYSPFAAGCGFQHTFLLLQSWPQSRLRAEGVALFGLAAAPDGAVARDVVLKFFVPEQALPFHSFSQVCVLRTAMQQKAEVHGCQ